MSGLKEIIQVKFLQQCLAQKVLVIVVTTITAYPPLPDLVRDLNYKGREATTTKVKRDSHCVGGQKQDLKKSEEEMIGKNKLI